MKLFKFQKTLTKFLKTLTKKKLSPVYGQNTEKLKIIFPKFCFGCPPLTIKKLLSKFYEIQCTSNEVIQVSKNFNQIFKNFNQKKTKSSLWPKYGKIENYFFKILLLMSSFDHKEASDHVL